MDFFSLVFLDSINDLRKPQNCASPSLVPVPVAAMCVHQAAEGGQLSCSVCM